MMQRVAGWVFGCMAIVADVMGIWTARSDESLKVIGEVELHPAGWALLAAAFTGLWGALVVPTLVERWWTARHQERIRRFKALLPEIVEVRAGLRRDSPLEGGPRQEDDPEYWTDLFRQKDLEAKLRTLGIALYSVKYDEYSILIDMAERGAAGEAQKRFGVRSTRRVVEHRRGQTPRGNDRDGSRSEPPGAGGL